MTDQLETRITAALSAGRIHSATLAALIEQTQAAISKAEAEAEAAAIKALDDHCAHPTRPRHANSHRPPNSPPNGCATCCPSYSNAMPRCSAPNSTTHGAQPSIRWCRGTRRRPRSCGKSTPSAPPSWCDALQEAREIDQEVRRVANAKPHHLPQANNDGRILPTVEAAARGLPGGVSQDFSIMNLKLPVWNKPSELLWPPREPNLAVLMAASIPTLGDPRSYTGRWHEVEREKAEAARARRNGGGRHEPRPR